MVENVLRSVKNVICFKNFVRCCNMAEKIKLFAEDLLMLFILERNN